MTLRAKIADYLNPGISKYVPAMSYASDVQLNAPTRVSFGAPIAADTDAIITQAQDLETNNAKTLTTFLGVLGKELDGTYGRAVSATLGAAAGAGTTVVITIKGRDYLGQRVTETISIAHATGTTTVAGKKAFKYIDSISSDGGGSADSYALVGVIDALGLPYKAIKCLSEETNGALVSTLGTLVTPVLTDPATATTGDPRGTFDPQTTLTGSAVITGTFIFDNTINSAGNGGLHGIAHFFAG